MIVKRTLKNKIQSSMFKTAFITLVISLVITLPLIYSVANPAMSFLSQSINNYILQNYIAKFDSAFEMTSKQYSRKLTVDLTVSELIDLYDNSIDNNTDITADFNILNTNLNITIDSLNEYNQKLVILSMINVVKEVEEIIPFRNIILTEFKVKNSPIFSIPFSTNSKPTTSIDYFEDIILNDSSSSFWENQLVKIYDKSKSVLSIYNRNNELIGTITTAINPTYIYSLMIPILVVFSISALLALVVARLMSKLLSIPILKPIYFLNKQLRSIAHDGFNVNKQQQIELKRPPKEIESLRNHTNLIMEKMQIYYEELEEHKDELEAQNLELEAQNIELIESKHLIKSQQNQLVQIEKLASIGQLSAAIAHEINTPLGAIKSNNQIIDMIIPIIEKSLAENEDTKVKKAIKNLKSSNSINLDATQKMSEIIRNLKNFSRLDQSDYQNANINEGIESVLVLTSNLWKNKVNIVKDFADLPLISCFPGMLNQVFMNIIVNAIQGSKNNGTITIRSKYDNKYVYIEIEDYGIGISNDNLNKIFDSGFTTKDKDKGTGLGLSISKDIIEKHNGLITVTSEINKGSHFIIKLPITHNE